MSTTRKIAHNTIVQIIGKIISTVLGLVAFGLMGHYLGTEKFGWYITVISFLQFVGILIDFGLIPVTAQMLSEPDHNQETLLANLLGFRLTTAVIFLGLAPFAALFFPYPNTVKIAITFSTISFVSVAINQILTGYYQKTLAMHIHAMADVIGRLVLLSGLWLFIHGNAGFLPIMGVLVTANVAQTTVLLTMANRQTKLYLAFDWVIWKNIIKKMWPIAISITFNVIYLRGDTLILPFFRSQTEVGLYGAAYQVINIVAQMAMMIAGVVLPLLAFAWARNMKEEFNIRYQQLFDSLMMFGLPATMGIYLVGEKIIVLVMGEKFHDAGQLLQILSIAVIGVYLGAVFGHTAVALNKQKQTMWIYLSNAVLTLMGYLLFIPRYGAIGAAWMSVFSELYAGILLFVTISYFSKVKLRLNTFMKIILSSFVMSIVILQIKNYPLFVILPIGMITYATTLIATKGISLSTIKEIISIKKI